MKLVTFGKPMAPHGVGDTRLVSDEKAKQLDAEGVLAGPGEPWPARPARATQAPRRSILTPQRPAGVPDKRIAE